MGMYWPVVSTSTCPVTTALGMAPPQSPSKPPSPTLRRLPPAPTLLMVPCPTLLSQGALTLRPPANTFSPTPPPTRPATATVLVCRLARKYTLLSAKTPGGPEEKTTSPRPSLLKIPWFPSSPSSTVPNNSLVTI